MTSCQAGGKQVSFSHNAESPFIIRILNLTFWDLLFFEGKNEVPSPLYDNATSTQLLKHFVWGFITLETKIFVTQKLCDLEQDIGFSSSSFVTARLFPLGRASPFSNFFIRIRELWINLAKWFLRNKFERCFCWLWADKHISSFSPACCRTSSILFSRNKSHVW